MTRFPLLLTAVFLPLCACSESAEETEGRADLTTVTRGDLTISVTESGEIKAANSTLVKNEMEGNSTIIQLIDEGSIVKKGDLLVELDASGQIERRSTQEIAVQKAKAAVINARKSLEILRKQVESQNRGAMNTWEFAKMDKQKFYGEVIDATTGEREMGEQVQSIKAEEAEIELAKSEVKLAQERYNWSRRLRAKDFITKDDLERDELDLKSKDTRLTLAINRLAILKKYTHEKTKRELDQAELDAKLEYERTVQKGEAEITQAEADLFAKIKEEELATKQLANLEKQIKNARVLAPTPGIVVYASEGDRWRRRTVEIGTQVRERQSLIILPDTTVMHAELKIQEVMIDRIHAGLPTEIKIDTSEELLQGKVLRRAPLPDSGSRGGNPDLKEYKTTVIIDGKNEKQLLRPNMSATVTIIIDQLKDVLSVKQQAVRSQGAVNYVWLNTPEGPVAQVVELGSHNESYVVIEEGLEEGQQIYLVEPDGMKPPEFEQPQERKRNNFDFAEAAMTRTKDAATAKATADAAKKRGARGAGPAGSRRNGGKGAGGKGGSSREDIMNSPAMAKVRAATSTFKALVKEKNPELHVKIEAAGMRWSRNAEIKSSIESDPDLSGAFATYQTTVRSAFSGMGGGGGSRGRGAEGSRRGGRPGRGGGQNN